MATIAERRQQFRKLHESGCFIIPNPWDIGSAKYLASIGFKALATTSSGFAFTKGLADSPLMMQRDLVLQHCRDLSEATDLPVSADFQNGYGSTPEEVAESVRLCVETGIAGLSIEDSTGEDGKPLFEISEALERLQAAREAIDRSGTGVMLTARAECFLVGHADPLNESLKRLQAYAEAGADLLFAPCAPDPAILKSIVGAVTPKPVNAIVSAYTPLSLNDFAALGVRRISVGSSLARAAWDGFIRAAEGLKNGSFAQFDHLTPFAELNKFFTTTL